MKYLFLALLLCLVCQPLSAQEAFSTIEERMTGKEFSETGLSKLTPEELAALNRWLRSHSVATLETAASTGRDMRGLENVAREAFDDSTIVARIVGSFDGWSGKGTIFRLDNGMVWEQAENGKFNIPAVDGPLVSIEQGSFSSWHLKVEGYNKTVRVERLQ